MSDDLGTDAGTGAPNVSEPVTVDGGRAPAAKPEKIEAAPVKAPPKPRTADDDFEDLLKKSGGLKYKAGGKEKAITSTADLKRLLSRVDGTESAASEALKARQEAESVKAQVAQLAKMKPAERIKALAGMGIDPKTIREAFEEEILSRDDEEKAQAHLTPREREYEAKLREREAELEQYREQQEAAQREQQEQEQIARIAQVGKRLESAAVGALTKAKIAPDHMPHFLGTIADRLDRNERLGLELDEGEIADAVMQEHGQLADQFYGGLDLPALSERLEAILVDDPDKPGIKVSRLKLLMRHEAAKIRARQGGNVSAPVRHAPPQQQQSTAQSKADLMDAARTFGGGSTF